MTSDQWQNLYNLWQRESGWDARSARRQRVLDIGPLAGTALTHALLEAIGMCAPEIGASTLVTNGSRPLAMIEPVMPGSGL